MEQIETNHGQSAFIETKIGPNGFIGEAYLGNKFYIIDASGPLWVKTNNTSEIEFKQGQGQQFAKQFKRVELRNKSATNTIFVKIWVGFGDYIDRRFQLIESQTALLGSGETTLADTATLTMDGIPTGNQIQRRSLIITNLDLANDLEITDGNDNEFCVIPFRQVISLDTSDEVKIVNNSGGVINLRVGEIWYVS